MLLKRILSIGSEEELLMSSAIKRIRTGPCNHKLYGSIIEILNEITGFVWGFVQPKRKIAYVTSEKIPIKIGTGPKSDCIVKKSMGENWKSTLRFDVCQSLLKFIDKHQTPLTTAEVQTLKTKLSAVQFEGISAAEPTIDLNSCREVNTYQSTFVVSNNSWIAEEINSLEKPKILSREDYM
jgi:hypothetical protein